MTILAVIFGSLFFGFLFYGVMVWLMFHDPRKDPHGQTTEQKFRAADNRFKTRLRKTKAAWSKDIDEKELADLQGGEWENRRRFDGS